MGSPGSAGASGSRRGRTYPAGRSAATGRAAAEAAAGLSWQAWQDFSPPHPPAGGRSPLRQRPSLTRVSDLATGEAAGYPELSQPSTNSQPTPNRARLNSAHPAQAGRRSSQEAHAALCRRAPAIKRRGRETGNVAAMKEEERLCRRLRGGGRG